MLINIGQSGYGTGFDVRSKFPLPTGQWDKTNPFLCLVRRTVPLGILIIIQKRYLSSR